MTKADKEGQRKAPILRFKGFTDDWEQRKLLKVCKKEDNKRIPIKEQERKEGNTPYFGANGIQGYIDGYTHDGTNILIAEDGANNVKNYPIKLITGKIWVNNHAHVLNVNTKTNNGNFLVGAIKKINFYRYLVGSSRYKLTAESLSQVKIEITEQSEQEKIGELFKSIEELLTLYERKLKLLSQVKKYFLDNLFTEKEYPNLRFKGFTDAWEQRKLGKVATFINGRAYKQNELLDSGKYKVLRVGNFYTNDSWYYSNLELADKYYIDKGDLVYTWSATFGPHIWNGEKVIYHYHIWKIELSKFLDRYFTLQILEADKAKLLANTNGSTMIHVTKKGMESKVISLPTIEEQKQIGLYLTEFDTLIALYENKKQNLIEIKKSLLNTMFI